MQNSIYSVKQQAKAWLLGLDPLEARLEEHRTGDEEVANSPLLPLMAAKPPTSSAKSSPLFHTHVSKSRAAALPAQPVEKVEAALESWVFPHHGL